jgi:hypothetical protein
MFKDPQVTHSGFEKCDCCEGTGKAGSECCGEHATDTKCDCCDGTGEVEFDIIERKRDNREEYLETLAD